MYMTNVVLRGNVHADHWHRDGVRAAGLFPQSRELKMFIYLSDVAADGGPLGVVPGSSRLPLGPWETLRTSFRSSLTLDAALPQDKMPNHYAFVAPAGTALLFDLATWHSALPIVPSSPDRRALILGWNTSTGGGRARGGTGQVPDSAVPPLLSAEHSAQLDAAGRLTPALRKLTGVA